MTKKSDPHRTHERIHALDALRGIAACAVAVPHFFMERGKSNWGIDSISLVGVEIFFVLSGFVLAPQLIYCMERHSGARIRTFLIRRWMRTLPPYLLALVAIAIFTGNLWTMAFVQFALFIQNFFHVDAAHDFFTVAWSLSVEEWFYLLFPPFLYLLRRAGVSFFKIVLAFFAIFLLSKIVGALYQSDWVETGRRIVIYRLDSICVGFGIYLFIDRLNRADPNWVRLISGFGLAVSAAGLAWVLAHIYSPGTSIYWRFAYFYVVSAFGAFILIFFHFLEAPFRKSKWLAKAATLGGDLSYDIYLFHIVILLILIRKMPHVAALPLFGIYAALVAGVSWAVRRNFEDPILTLRPSYPKPPELK